MVYTARSFSRKSWELYWAAPISLCVCGFMNYYFTDRTECRRPGECVRREWWDEFPFLIYIPFFCLNSHLSSLRMRIVCFERLAEFECRFFCAWLSARKMGLQKGALFSFFPGACSHAACVKCQEICRADLCDLLGGNLAFGGLSLGAQADDQIFYSKYENRAFVTFEWNLLEVRYFL